MKNSWVYSRVLVILWGAVCGAVFYDLEEEDETVLVDNKCQCVKVTTKFVPSEENPEEKILVRNIRIVVPLQTRENISDPNSPVRTKFVYDLSKLCQERNVANENLESEDPVPGRSTLDSDPTEPCYTYDRNKCYTASYKFSYGGKTKIAEAALTPESCYVD